MRSTGKDYLIETAIRADFALVQAFLADYIGNLTYALTARNFNPVIAMAADTVIVAAEHIVPVGVIAPDHVATPSSARRLPRLQWSDLMDAQTIIAKRIAQELRSGMLVNLGIGIPTLVANYLPPGITVLFQSENGLIGTGPIPEDGMAHRLLTDAGGRPVSALPGASTFDSAMSFGLIRGGHVDMTVLGGLQVDQQGTSRQLDDPRQDGARHGRRYGPRHRGEARRSRDATHGQGQAQRCVKTCTLPLTSARPVSLVVSELAVIDFPDGKARLSETAPGVTVEQILASTEAELILPDRVATMAI